MPLTTSWVARLACLIGAATSVAPVTVRGAEAPLPAIIGAAEIFAAERLSGVALRGFDPVAYFERGTAVAGRGEFEMVWGGAAWRFASAANREAFRTNPTAFAPRLGGYDAAAVADGRVVAAEPSIFALQGGRLYLFRHHDSRRAFLDDPAATERAETRWLTLQRDLVQP